MAMRAPNQAHGVSYQYVVVDEISPDKAYALCRTAQGAPIQVPMGLRQGAGGWPQPGQTWVIGRSYGGWAFEAIQGQQSPPVIDASRQGAHPLLLQVFDALVHLGLVEDAGFTE